MAEKSKTKIFFDNSVTWVAVVAGLATIVVAENVILKPDPKLGSPLEHYEQRDKKLTFGLFVTPNSPNNPIQPPERFTGYHSALDIEILPGEESRDVAVYAACEGEVLTAREAEGYGGVIAQSCEIEGVKLSLIYGHLDFRSFQVETGNKVRKGQKIAILGDAKSIETGYTRKHLHFGVHKGDELVLAGYVQNERELEEFIDPQPLLE